MLMLDNKGSAIRCIMFTAGAYCKRSKVDLTAVKAFSSAVQGNLMFLLINQKRT